MKNFAFIRGDGGESDCKRSSTGSALSTSFPCLPHGTVFVLGLSGSWLSSALEGFNLYDSTQAIPNCPVEISGAPLEQREIYMCHSLGVAKWLHTHTSHRWFHCGSFVTCLLLSYLYVWVALGTTAPSL